MARPKPVVLVILDGWGLSDIAPTAVTEANITNFRNLMGQYPNTCLEAAGKAVGLMTGQMGDSNVGHLNIGAGRIVYQDLVRISNDIRDGTFFSNQALTGAVDNAKKRGSALHIMGLLSDGGVHSHQEHLYAILELAKSRDLESVFIHAFLDGRDVPPSSAATYLKNLEQKIYELGVGRIASITGRYYAMDRDKRWDRTKAAYDMLTLGTGRVATDWREALDIAYEKGETDEFVYPTVIGHGREANWEANSGMADRSCGCRMPDLGMSGPDGQEHVSHSDDVAGKNGIFSRATLEAGDSLIFFNFRADRARQIAHAFCDDDFSEFSRKKHPRAFFAGMLRYEEGLGGQYAYNPLVLKNTLGELVSKAGLRQLRIAETEKYAHVTFFFNGKKEEAFPGEDRHLVPSPKVSTYDQKPEMSAFEVTEEAIRRIESGKYDLVILNYANPDMVGHTGCYDAAKQALEAVDQCLGKLLSSVVRFGGVALVIADHGNVEELSKPGTCIRAGGGSSHTYHTSNKVPCILVAPRAYEESRIHEANGINMIVINGKTVKGLREGILADVAPTLLEILGLEKPPEMDRNSLIVFR